MEHQSSIMEAPNTWHLVWLGKPVETGGNRWKPRFHRGCWHRAQQRNSQRFCRFCTPNSNISIQHTSNRFQQIPTAFQNGWASFLQNLLDPFPFRLPATPIIHNKRRLHQSKSSCRCAISNLFCEMCAWYTLIWRPNFDQKNTCNEFFWQVNYLEALMTKNIKEKQGFLIVWRASELSQCMSCMQELLNSASLQF